MAFTPSQSAASAAQTVAQNRAETNCAACSASAGACGSVSAGQYVGNVSDHRGKYYTGSGSTGNAGVSPGCLESKASAGAVAFDPVDNGCWGVTGQRIVISDKFESIMAGFEKVNFNFHVSGTQPAVPNQFSLPGPVSVTT